MIQCIHIALLKKQNPKKNKKSTTSLRSEDVAFLFPCKIERSQPLIKK